MLGLDNFIKYLDDHPKLIIGTLLAIIIVGGLSGGIWIKNLENGLSEQKELNESRLALVKERYKSATFKLNSRYNDFEYDINRLKREVAESSDSLVEAVIELEDVYKDNEDIKINIDAFTKKILDRQLRLDSNIAKVGDDIAYSYSEFQEYEQQPLNSPRYFRPLPFLLMIICIILSLLLIRKGKE